MRRRYEISDEEWNVIEPFLQIAKACDASFEGVFTLNDTGKQI
jgi:transposase